MNTPIHPATPQERYDAWRKNYSSAAEAAQAAFTESENLRASLGAIHYRVCHGPPLRMRDSVARECEQHLPALQKLRPTPPTIPLSEQAPSPHEQPLEIPCKDLKPNTDYWATFDFVGQGGKKVRLKKRFPAKDYWPGTRGEACLVVTEEGVELCINPKAWLFGSDPRAHATPAAEAPRPRP